MHLKLSLTLGLFILSSAAAAQSIDRHIHIPPLERPADASCAGDLDAPIDIVVEAFAPLSRPGGFVEVFGTVTARQDLDGVRLRFDTEGTASVFNRAPWRVGRMPAGVPVEFSLLARFGPQGGAIHVWADSDLQKEYLQWSKRETLYGVVHRNRLYTGMGDAQRLQVMAFQDDVRMGLLTPVEARQQITSMAIVPAIRHNRPFVRHNFSAEEERLNAIVGARTRPRNNRLTTDDHHGSNILVQGNVSWTDENGTTHPVFGASVSIRDDDTLGDETITVVGTDVNGNYEAVVDNDDGLGAGNRDIYVVVRAANTLINTENGSGDTYEMQSGIYNETPNGTTITENFVAPNTGNGPAFSVHVGATWIAVYTQQVHGSALSSVDVVWPNGSGGSFFDGAVKMEQADRWDWDTIHHEYGHYVMRELDIEDNPGGPHNIGDCTAVTRSSKDEGLRLAWGEGWPTYFGTAGQAVMNMASLNVPRVGDVSYQDFEDGSLSYSLEAQDNNGIGEDNEVSVQRLLWDLFDSNNDGRDTISRSDNSIWTAVDAANPRIPSTAWTALRAGQSNAVQLQMGGIAADHRMGPRLVSPAAGAIVSPANAIFGWNADVGCSSTTAGDDFDLVFYDASTFDKLLTIPGLNGLSTALSPAQLASLTATTHEVLWAVEGRNTDSPATGPYLGESRAATVNQPPVADAGADQTVECTSAGTTAVALNGSGSSDADGDTLTYHWSAPGGVTFDSQTSATPVGQFPVGTHVVTLTVSDGIQQDSDTVTVTVQDTTPPVVSCPIDVTAECTGDLGVQASDPQLAAFFAGATATDTCDWNPTITHDAPAFFPLGTTTVTFTATDAHGNSSSCTAKVTVIDTQAPTVTATLDTTSLWPPNHKLVTVNAAVTVTDECDPNPTFVLTSITSNEPDNGLGDGDQPNDIQGAEYGTPDTTFQVRAERGGPRTGRVYTVTYTGSDSSGNTSVSVLQVMVPHN